VKRTFAHHAHVWTELRLGEERDWSACRINLEGNLGSVFAMAFSPNSQLLASSSRDNTIAIWDVSTGNCHSIIVEHTHPVSSLVFSPDGRLLASGSHDKTIRIWNTGTWTRKATLAGHTEAVATLAWSQDSRIVVTGSYDKTVKLWDIENGSCYATFCVYGGDCVYAVAISPDNRLVAFTSDTDGTVRIWDTTTMSCCHIINGRRAVLAIQFSSDSGIIAVAVEYYYDSICGKGCNEVNFYDVKTGRNCASFDFGTETQFVAFSSDLENVAYLENNTIILWSYSTGLCHTHLESCANFGTDIPTISPDHALVATTGVDGTIMIWDTSATPKNHNALEGNVRFQDEAVWAMTSSPDGKLFASRHVDQIKVWDSETGTCIHSFECPLAPGETRDHKIHLEFSPNSLILAYTTGNGCGSELRLHSMQSWSCCAYFDHTYHIEQVQISQDGEHIVSQSANGTIRLWKIAHGICIRVLEDKSCYKPDSILCLSQNNNFVAVGSPDDGTIDLWNVTTGFSKTLAGHMDPIENLVFSPNSQLLASNSSATRIMLWDVERASCQLIIETNVQFSTLLAFSPNSKLLASLDCTIRLWDTKTGQCRHIFPTIPRWARSVAFSPCGTYLQTNAGKLAVPASLLDRAMVTQLPPCVFVGKRWIYLNGAPVFWLPEEYRPEVMQISGTTIFLRTREDKFTIVRLDLDQLKRIYPRLFESAQEGKRTVV
jgi:WD40 repeat protein